MMTFSFFGSPRARARYSAVTVTAILVAIAISLLLDPHRDEVTPLHRPRPERHLVEDDR
jgi:hypothetical protein